MKREAKDNPGLRAYDAETGEMVHGVQWWDDETGEYEQSVHLVSEDGLVMYFADPERPGKTVSVLKQGGIVVRKPLPQPTQEDALKATPGGEPVEYNLSYRPDDE